jgi:hypothetical protein
MCILCTYILCTVCLLDGSSLSENVEHSPVHVWACQARFVRDVQSARMLVAICNNVSARNSTCRRLCECWGASSHS